MCSGRIHPKFIMEAFFHEIDGILVVGCHLEDCHYFSGINETVRMIKNTKKNLGKIGLNPKRLGLAHISAGEAVKYAETVNNFSIELTKLGPLKLNAEQKEKMAELKMKKPKKVRKEKPR